MSDDTKLPEGKTCRDCAHYRRCSLMFGALSKNTYCDWSPSRFHPHPTPEPILGGNKHE